MQEDVDDGWRWSPRHGRGRALLLGLALGLCLAGAAIGAASLRAARGPATPPSVTLDFDPLPEDSAPAASAPVTIGVYGDSMADGLYLAFAKALRGNGGFRVLRFSHPSTGLVRYDFRDVGAQTAAQVAEQPVDVAVVLIGANDKQGMIRDGRIVPFDSEEWRAIYVERMREMATTLRRSGAAVFWIGLPKMRSAAFDAGASRIAQIQEETARALAVPFLPTAPATSDAAGLYDVHGDGGAAGPVLRAPDGVHMTVAGYARLAAPVLDQIRGYLANRRARGAPVALAAAGAP